MSEEKTMRGSRSRMGAMLLAASLLAGAAMPAAAVTYDLTSDWSNTANPNGVWSYNAGSAPLLPFQPAWFPGQGAWANAPFPASGHVPVWLRAEQPFIDAFALDLVAGDVTVHGRCCSDLPGTGEANVTWTSDVAGVATLSGHTWWGGFGGRSADWTLALNGTVLTGGNVGSGTGHTRATPFDFADGSGGAAVLSFDVGVGDVVRFQVDSPGGQFDHFVGVDLTVDLEAAVPAPATWTLLSLGLLCLRRRRRAGPTRPV